MLITAAMRALKQQRTRCTYNGIGQEFMYKFN